MAYTCKIVLHALHKNNKIYTIDCIKSKFLNFDSHSLLKAP